MRLAEIEEEFAGTVSVEWRSYLLRPKPEERTLESFTRYTKKWATPGEMEPRATFNTWSGEHEPPSHSVPSSVAGKVAATFGRDAYRRYSMALFEAYFTDNRTISDVSVLMDLAEGAGIEPSEFAARWESRAHELTEAVYTDYMSAVQSEITGVPAVVINRSWVIPGAVDTDHYRHLIARAQERLDPIWDIEARIAAEQDKAEQDRAGQDRAESVSDES